MEKDVWKKFADDVDKLKEPPYKVNWPAGKKSPGIEYPTAIEALPKEFEEVAQKLDAAKKEYDDLMARYGKFLEEKKVEEEPYKKEKTERETSIQMMGQQLGGLLEGKVGIVMKHWHGMIVMIKKAIEQTKTEPSYQTRYDNVVKIIKDKLGPAADDLLDSIKRSEAAMLGAQKAIPKYDKQIVEFPPSTEAKKVFVGSKLVEADFMTNVKVLFTNLWNTFASLFEPAKMVTESLEEILAVLGEQD